MYPRRAMNRNQRRVHLERENTTLNEQIHDLRGQINEYNDEMNRLAQIHVDTEQMANFTKIILDKRANQAKTFTEWIDIWSRPNAHAALSDTLYNFLIVQRRALVDVNQYLQDQRPVDDAANLIKQAKLLVVRNVVHKINYILNDASFSVDLNENFIIS